MSLSSNAQMLVNRFAKNEKRLAKWRKNNSIDVYRSYDADIPEFAAAIDVYHLLHGRRCVVVQEYAPPKSVDPDKAAQRLLEIEEAIKHFYEIDEGSLFMKARQRQRGTEQYQRSEKVGKELLVQEGAATLKVNLTDFLDTGLFLDHRAMRRYVYENSRGKSVLNLFCYTASVSVHAALGGAAKTLSLDMSNTYLDWARRNFLQNKMDKELHKLKREDCVEWLEKSAATKRPSFDLIFLDPPSFSNSKKMDDVLDIQRDHVKLIKHSMALLRFGGELIFSNNLRSFKLDTDALGDYEIQPYHKPSIDPDFERNAKIHQCFLIRHRKGS